jgi:hypothetical protein
MSCIQSYHAVQSNVCIVSWAAMTTLLNSSCCPRVIFSCLDARLYLAIQYGEDRMKLYDTTQFWEYDVYNFLNFNFGGLLCG